MIYRMNEIANRIIVFIGESSNGEKQVFYHIILFRIVFHAGSLLKY